MPARALLPRLYQPALPAFFCTQVELNTIASSFGCLSSQVTRMHRYILSRLPLGMLVRGGHRGAEQGGEGGRPHCACRAERALLLLQPLCAGATGLLCCPSTVVSSASDRMLCGDCMNACCVELA